MGQYLLGVLEPLGHLGLLALQGGGDGVVRLLALLVHVGHQFGLGAEDDLRLVLEVDLG